MWPNMEIDMLMGKLDAIRDILRIAYGAEGDNRTRLFQTARDMLRELSDKMGEEAPDEDE
jgi:hypothetical protein